MKKLIASLIVLASFQTFATELSCNGTEPFWTLKITDQKLIYNSFNEENENQVLTITSKQNAQGMSEDSVFVVNTKYTSATVISGECSDGMSDVVYPKHIVFKVDNSVFYGCCK